MSRVRLPGNRTLRVRIAVSFVNRLLDSMVTSFMAIYLASAFGAASAGLLIFAVVGLGVLAMLVGGHIADKHGRKRTLLLAEAGMAASFAVMAVAVAASRTPALLVYGGYLVNRLAASMALPASDAMIVDVTTPQTRKQAYAVNYWAVNLALATGSLLGAWLYVGHFTAMLTGAAVCATGVLLTTVFLIRETRPATTTVAATPHEFFSGYRAVLRDRRFVRFTAAATLTLAIEFQLVNYVGVRLASDMPPQDLFPAAGLTVHVTGVQMLGLLRAENTVLVVLLALFSRRLFRRLPDRFALYFGVALFVGGYLVLAVSNTGWLLMVAGFVYTVGELMNVPVKQALLADMVPDTARTRYLAAYNLNIRFAQIVAALFITIGSVVPPYGMAVLYAVIGVAIVMQYRSVLAPPRPAERMEEHTG